MENINWEIHREGRAWKGDEAWARFELTPEKTEMRDGKLYWSERDRLTMLGLLLENVGADRVVRFGDPNIWRSAVAGLEPR